MVLIRIMLKQEIALPLNALTDQAYVLHPFESTQKRFSFSEGEG